MLMRIKRGATQMKVISQRTPQDKRICLWMLSLMRLLVFFDLGPVRLLSTKVSTESVPALQTVMLYHQRS
ncbi:hypothetical protein Lal_00038017 [Lupinus albus]|nr:hypothetical protein Lal_00038017 [Lupinus albus]